MTFIESLRQLWSDAWHMRPCETRKNARAFLRGAFLIGLLLLVAALVALRLTLSLL